MKAPVVKIPKLHSVTAMLALAPRDVADVSKTSMTGLMAKVAAQLKRLSLCVSRHPLSDLSSYVVNLNVKRARDAHKAGEGTRYRWAWP